MTDSAADVKADDKKTEKKEVAAVDAKEDKELSALEAEKLANKQAKEGSTDPAPLKANKVGLASSDADDPSLGWTVHSPSREDDKMAHPNDESAVPGQFIDWHELPLAKSVEDQGLDSKAWPLQLPLSDEAQEKFDK